jgi:Chaperone of endosialidase
VPLDFPAAPIIGALYPDPPLDGVTQYRWDGIAWKAGYINNTQFVFRAGDSMSGPLTLQADPVSSLQAATKQYVDTAVSNVVPAPPDLSGYLPLTGGTLTGPLETTSLKLPYEASTPLGGAAIRWQGAAGGPIGLYVNGGVTFQGDAGNPSLMVSVPTTDGTLGPTSITLHGPSGGITANAVTVLGDITARRADTTGYFFPGNSGARYYGFDGGSMIINGSGANTRIVGALSADAGITAGTTINAGNSILTAANFHLNSGNGLYFEQGNSVRMYWNGGHVVVTHGFNAPTLHAACTYSHGADTANQWTLYNDSSGYQKHYRMSGSSFEMVNHAYTAVVQVYQDDGNAGKIGGGPWFALSDARIKNVVGEYEAGLEAIIALRPVRYTYKGNESYYDPATTRFADYPEVRADQTAPYFSTMHHDVALSGKQFIGLVAQEAETIMPELIFTNEAYIDGQPVTDLRNLDAGPLVFALINAVKELKSMNDVLMARIEALEASR